MARTDIYLDAMLRHLGAAYYESLHGRAARSDVTRALDTVEDHLKEHPRHGPGAASPHGRPHPERAADGAAPPGGHRRWARRVRDVMSTSVVTVDRITPYQEIARLLAEHRISGVPVLTMGRHVAGVVSEADLIAAADNAARQARRDASAGRRHLLRRRPHTALTAETLMTAPAVTIDPEATIPAAARAMTTHHIRRLPVVDPDGRLIGIVSRRDLLSVFLRPDQDIAADVRQLLDELPLADPAGITVLVRHGVVTLTGALPTAPDAHAGLVRLAIRLIWDVDGVVDVVNRLGKPATPAAPAPGE
jgi:CBS domain-containing protein